MIRSVSECYAIRTVGGLHWVGDTDNEMLSLCNCLHIIWTYGNKNVNNNKYSFNSFIYYILLYIGGGVSDILTLNV